MFEVAARVLDARTGRVQFVFCGDGPLRSDGELQLQRFSEVHFLGWQPNSIVLSLMHRATVVLVPMSGFVLLEAAALGKTVVASRIEWHGEIIADGDNGCLVRIDAVDEWCDRVFWLLDHPSEARLMGTKLQAVFEARYTAEISLKREADLYSRLIASAA
jgi:glycosyltransferase involved in cell wall biosynthesis